jgi:N-acyl homoserine lactone hydrolase
MENRDLTIHPLDLGTLVSIDSSIFTLHRNPGIKVDVPCIGWLILGGQGNVLVDTGPCDPEWASTYHRPLKKSGSQEMPAALQTCGLSPGDVETVIFTHLHWDHCFNLEHFPNAVFYVQKSELQYAISPLPNDNRTYEIGIPGVQPSWMRVFGRMKVVDGDREILPGIHLLHLPGHSPGSQGVVVETADGPWLIAGDDVPLYENWEGDGVLDRIPSGIYQNLPVYYESLRKMERYGTKVLPGHDEKVLIRCRYPER